MHKGMASPLSLRRAVATDGVQATAVVAWSGVLFILAVAALQLAWAFERLPYHVPIGANEGWNAIHAARAMLGAELYPPAGAFMFDN